MTIVGGDLLVYILMKLLVALGSLEVGHHQMKQSHSFYCCMMVIWTLLQKYSVSLIIFILEAFLAHINTSPSKCPGERCVHTKTRNHPKQATTTQKDPQPE